jgi:hypothetical protein
MGAMGGRLDPSPRNQTPNASLNQRIREQNWAEMEEILGNTIFEYQSRSILSKVKVTRL